MDLRIELPTGKQDNDGVSRHVAIGKIGRLLDTIDGDAAVMVSVFPPIPKVSYPSDASAPSLNKKADYLDSIHHLAMEYARSLMAMDIDEPELIVDLLHVAGRAKKAKGRYLIATHPYQQWNGADSSGSMSGKGGVCDGKSDEYS